MTGVMCDPANMGPEQESEDWFAFPGSPAYRRAVKACGMCPAAAKCAIYALEEGIPHGVFGGVPGRVRRATWRSQGGRPKDHLEQYNRELAAMDMRRGPNHIKAVKGDDAA